VEFAPATGAKLYGWGKATIFYSPAQRLVMTSIYVRFAETAQEGGQS